jgi:hypothetical protein
MNDDRTATATINTTVTNTATATAVSTVIKLTSVPNLHGRRMSDAT